MNLRHFHTAVPPELGAALARFEHEFTYPLGTSSRFRISHGEGYLPFFKAMGRADLALLEDCHRVIGGLARVERRLILQGGESVPAHYLCDLKLRAEARGSTALPRLIRETRRLIEESGSVRCYCVVMGGTGKLPTDYTGRLGVPRFENLGEIVVLRLESEERADASSWAVSHEEFEEVFRDLPRAGYAAAGADRSIRSLMTPLHLITAGRDACGIIEDTRRGKRLFADDGGEMLSAHLSRFAFASPEAGARLLRDAVARALEEGMPALFVALPASKAASVMRELQGLRFTQAPATVFGHALETDRDWWVDTAEI